MDAVGFGSPLRTQSITDVNAGSEVAEGPDPGLLDPDFVASKNAARKKELPILPQAPGMPSSSPIQCDLKLQCFVSTMCLPW